MLPAVMLGLFMVCIGPAQAQSGNDATNQIQIVEVQNTVEVSPVGATTWVRTTTNQVLYPHDRLRTGADSRVALRWSDETVISFGASTELEVLPPQSGGTDSGLRLVQGILSFFHRDKPGRIRIITRGAVAGIEGTEFVLSVPPDNLDRSLLSVIDGRVQFGNEQGTLVLTNGEQAVADAGRAPVRTPGFIVNNVLQWCFYYPAVLDPQELPLTVDEQQALNESLTAYRSGDLLQALARYPAGRTPGSAAEQIYYAALLLSVGEVEKTETALSSFPAVDPSGRLARLASALRVLIAAVKRQPSPAVPSPELATELLAHSYYEQSTARHDRSLEKALDLARQATVKSPQFGFAWARLAELEFGFGHSQSALEALNRAITLTPRNAQALALKGFVVAGRPNAKEAIVWFDQALAVDAALGNAWLGRGLSRIRRGDVKGGREDLLVAAALEPQRSELRSYLGKAYGDAGDFSRSARELELAKKLDANDPTPWLYSALLNQERNRINDAIRDLETSAALNENRSVYRSELLLDEDQAVRSANLAAMYRDAGMTDVAIWEAARAVNYDYGNFSAHLFLANSYTALRDPNLVNSRYETPGESEYLVANLLAPVSAGAISPTVSQQEYSRLFERPHFGLVSSTEYLSRGAWTESGAQYGAFEHFTYSIEGFYRTDPGQRVNNDVEQRQVLFAAKAQIAPDDTVYLRVRQHELEMGDVFQRYDPTMVNEGYRAKEDQEPIISLGYHHEWSPGVHTLFLVNRLEDTFTSTNPAAQTLVTFRPDIAPGETMLTSVQGITMHQHFKANLEIYSGELQQIWQQPAHNTIIGGRVQYGTFEVDNLQNLPSSLGFVFPDPPEPSALQDDESHFRRFSVYGYHQWEITDELQIIGGVTYDHITFPENFRNAPTSSREETVDQVSPKAGLIWRPAPLSTVRFAYTRSLGGASLDQSYQLEPSQVAGFVQSFRSIIPESVAGANSGAEFEAYDLSLEQKFPTGTYLGISGELLNSDVRRTMGAFDVLPDQAEFAMPSRLRQHLDYEEESLTVTANQLVGRDWSFGGRYRLSRAVLESDFVDVPDSVMFVDFAPRERSESVLHHASLFGIYNHPCGFFAAGEALWFAQNNIRSPGQPGDDFWQFNAFVGYRLPHRQAEVTLGLLNISDQDYRLSPLNLHNELPRERTLAVRLRLRF